MGLHNRPYWRDSESGSPYEGGMGSRISYGLPKPTPVVRRLLLINLVVFVLQLVARFAFRLELSDYLGATVAAWYEAWRYLTMQFLHSTYSIWHIGLNMLGLYMFGTALEGLWGPRRFLGFYLTCGAVAGATYVGAGMALAVNPNVPIIGASGGVYGLLLASAVLMPHFRVILFIFPVPIRLAAALIFGGAILSILTSVQHGVFAGGFWSEVAHLGGAVTAALWMAGSHYGLGGRLVSGARIRNRIRKGAWEKKMKAQAEERAEVDRILQKIHDEGINSLTRREKKLLQDATRHQQQEERDIYRA